MVLCFNVRERENARYSPLVFRKCRGLAEEEEARLTGQLKERQIAADQVYNVLVIAERVEAVVPQPPPLTPIDYSNGALMGMLMNKGNPDE